MNKLQTVLQLHENQNRSLKKRNMPERQVSPLDTDTFMWQAKQSGKCIKLLRHNNSPRIIYWWRKLYATNNKHLDAQLQI